MSLSVTPFRNRDNFAKYLLIHYETGSNVLLTVFSWLYNGPRPYEQNLLTFINAKTKCLNNNEKSTLVKLGKGAIQLHQLDFSLLFLIIKFSCNLLPVNEPVWGKNCPPDRQEELEHLLYLLKQSRNSLAHPSDAQKSISDLQILVEANEAFDLLRKILIKAGEKGKVPGEEVENSVRFTRQNIDKICGDEEHDAKIEPYIHQLIKEDLVVSYESELRVAIETELKGYSKPTLIVHKERGEEEQEVADILRNFQGDKNILQIRGRSGDGKTSLAKILFHTWLTGAEGFDGLSAFDVTFLIQCENINTRSISEFLETELPTAVNSFSNTSSLRRQLKASNILWILDGFDQGTAEAKGFLKEILEVLSCSQKLLITLRSNYKELVDLLIPSKLTVIAEIGFLKDKNVEEIIYNLASDKNRVTTWIETYHDIIKISPDQFRNPLTLNLWIQQLQRVGDAASDSLTQLYKTDFMYKLDCLAQRLESKAALNHLELRDKVNNWFHYLCYQSFHLICSGTYGTINKSSEESLKHQATLNYLIASDCISTFFPSINTKSDEYSYLHITQQYYFAALFLKKALADETTYSKMLLECRDVAFRNYDSRVNFLTHHRELILWLISIEVEDGAVFNNDVVMKALSFSQCEWSLRFVAYFIQASNNNEEFIRCIATKITEPCWYIFDDEVTLKAASRLIDITQPESIYFVFRYINSNLIKYIFRNLLSTIVTKYSNIQVIIIFSEYEKFGSSDQCYWHLPEIKKRVHKMYVEKFNHMNLNTFTGALSDCSFLRDCCSNLAVLHLRLCTEDCYLKFLRMIKNAGKLKVVRLTLDFSINKIITEYNLKFPKLYRPITKLIFPHLNNQNYREYVILVRKMCADDFYFNLQLRHHKFAVVSLLKNNLLLESQESLSVSLSKWVKTVNMVSSLVEEYGNIENKQWPKIIKFCEPRIVKSCPT